MSFYASCDDNQLGVLFVTFVPTSLLPCFYAHPDPVPAQNENHLKKDEFIIQIVSIMYFNTYASYAVC